MWRYRIWCIGLLLMSLLCGCAATQMSRGRRLMKQGEVEEAIGVLEQVTVNQPKNAAAWTELGIAYYRMGKLDRAEQALKTAQSLDPRNGRAVFFLGMTYEKMTPPPSGQTITVTLPGGAAMEMVWIEPGTFEMGSPSSDPYRETDEKPPHPVTITKGFWLGKYELTQGQWESVMGTTPWSGGSYVRENASNPAVYISWNEMQEFIRRLNQSEGARVYRLPTEAEWEYACRAGTTTPWSFGEDESRLKDYAWYYDNACGYVRECYAHAVGTKLPNPWGLYDMHGNVWEWVQDWYGSYSSGSQVDPVGPSTGSESVARGGSFADYARYTRSADRPEQPSGMSAFRHRHTRGGRNSALGVRLVRQGQ